MKYTFFVFVPSLLFSVFKLFGQVESQDSWWKHNNLRVIQINLPAYEAATLNPDSLIADLKKFAANTVIINAGGIMAYYPSGLESHYINPFMKPNMLGDVIRLCHKNNIKVITRFDFSRLDKTIYEKHPDWVYIDKNGEHMINTDKYVTCINAPYVQEKAFDIMAEVMDLYPIDGIFLNMPGYQTRNSYIDKYYGIDQNEYDRNRFRAYSGGLELPLEENNNDPIFQKYQEFKKYTTIEWQKKLHDLIKSKSLQIALCTYAADYVDIIRHESQTNALPYFPYNASDNVNTTMISYPDHIVSNASIQQISFQSRYNAIEPEESEIRFWENIANGSGLDMSMMGDMRGYEDERLYPVLEKIYNHHKKFENNYGKYQTISKIALVAPGWWPSGSTMQEYRGIQLMLNESHIPYDRIEDSQLGTQYEALKKYKVIILPDILDLNKASTEAIDQLLENGTYLIATNKSLSLRPDLLRKWFGVEIKNQITDCSGQYLSTTDHSVFTHLEGQSMVMLKFNLSEYEMSGCDQRMLPILAKGKPGPPEMIGGHDETGYYAIGSKKTGKGEATIVPINIGKLYYLQGYENHKNIFLDLLNYTFPEASTQLITNAHPRVETILKEYDFNDISALNNTFESKGLILHLINLTGFSGNTYFEPSPQNSIDFQIKTGFKPKKITTLEGSSIKFRYKLGYVKFLVDQLKNYKALLIQK
ncbi:MAG: family 10 glycosylhydrolase [Saprospiraceae bacterium]